MTEKERDSHFAGFAELLCNEEQLARFLDDPNVCSSGMRREIVDLIAQRAYDLVDHALEAVPNIIPEVQSLKASLESIPDLTEWPTPESS